MRKFLCRIPDKLADRIAGAIVDYCYTLNDRPKVAVEVLIGHDICHIIVETSEKLALKQIEKIVGRIAGNVIVDFQLVPQDIHLADNQSKEIKCGDNGIFKGIPTTQEQHELSHIAKRLYNKYKSDGKYILTDNDLIICQSNAKSEDIEKLYPNAKINPLGEWSGGINVDTGATNRKLGSDMGDAVTGGGINGKDLSKADVSVNIYCHLLAQNLKVEVQGYCAIGDSEVNILILNKDKVELKVPYTSIVEIARDYIKGIGGFEALAEWGLI